MEDTNCMEGLNGRIPLKHQMAFNGEFQCLPLSITKCLGGAGYDIRMQTSAGRVCLSTPTFE